MKPGDLVVLLKGCSLRQVGDVGLIIGGSLHLFDVRFGRIGGQWLREREMAPFEGPLSEDQLLTFRAASSDVQSDFIPDERLAT